jgi:ElaB/YqjD/DUF883 family membrane-anchored ribosome-binding protein
MADQQDRDMPTPMTDGDITPPPADTGLEPAAPLKDAGVEFTPADGPDSDGATDAVPTGSADAADAAPRPQGVEGAKQAVIEGTAKLKAEAGDKARSFVDENKAKATQALGQFTTMLNDAADQVDEKLGAQYGQYARSAAERVQAFSAGIDEKSVDDLLDDARELVRKSPAVAIGTAAALGFVVARVLTAGLDQRDA